MIGYVVYKLFFDQGTTSDSSSNYKRKPSNKQKNNKRRDYSSHKFNADIPIPDDVICNDTPPPKNKARSEPDVPHTKITHLATNNEQRFHLALQSVLSDDYVIHCQTSLMALIKPVNFKDNSKTWAKRMDFVITDKSTRVLAVIELDDSTHNWESRKKRDRYVNAVLKEHHHLVRFRSERFYDSDKIIYRLEQETSIECRRPQY